MPRWSGFTKLTTPELVDARCTLEYEFQHKKHFTEFVLIGFNDEEEEQFCFTAVDIRDLYRAIVTLQRVYEKAIGLVPEEERAKLELQAFAECMEEGMSFGLDEEDGTDAEADDNL